MPETVAIERLMAVLPGALLHVVRAAALVYLLPVLGARAAKLPRFVLATALGLCCWWFAGTPSIATASPAAFGALAAGEVVIGSALGFAVRAAFALPQLAGELIANEMGLSMARVMDPTTGTAHTAPAMLFEAGTVLLALELDLHHELVRAIVAANEALPIGSGLDTTAFLPRLTALAARVLTEGLLVVGPVLGVLWLLSVAMALLSRAVPQINLLEFGFGLRALVALAATLVFLPATLAGIERTASELLVAFRGLLAP